MQQNFWEQGNLMKVNFREHLNLFLGNKGKTPIFSREQGNMYPPPGRPSVFSVTPFKIDQNKNQNRSIDKVQHL